MFRTPTSTILSTDEKEQKVAGNLLDDIQYNLIHLVDCLREQKKDALAATNLNFLTALLTISMGKSQFIPLSIQNPGWGVHESFPAQQIFNEFLDLKSDLLASLDILSPKFTPNDKIMLLNSFERIEESKVILFKPPFEYMSFH